MDAEISEAIHHVARAHKVLSEAIVNHKPKGMLREILTQKRNSLEAIMGDLKVAFALDLRQEMEKRKTPGELSAEIDE